MIEPRGPLPRSGPPRQSYLVCTTPRTGSWYLCHALESTGVAGAPAEYFYPGAVNGWKARLGLEPSTGYGEYLDAVLIAATSTNGVFGAKVMWQYFPTLLTEVPQLDAVFPTLEFVFLERGDRATQAVSFWRAEQTEVWIADQGDAPAPPYDFDGIKHHYDLVAKANAAWRQWFDAKGIAPLSLQYEDVVADPALAVRAVLAHLRIPTEGIEVTRPAFARQGDEVSAEYRDRFLAAPDATD